MKYDKVKCIMNTEKRAEEGLRAGKGLSIEGKTFDLQSVLTAFVGASESLFEVCCYHLRSAVSQDMHAKAYI